MRFVAGFLFAVLLIPIFIYGYVRLGFAPVATSEQPLPFERMLAHVGLDTRIDKEAPKTPPFKATKEDLMSAAHLYREHCAVCHGLPAEPKTATAKGMYPAPPELLHGKGVTDDPAGVSYWKIANGIRLTGMPAYGKALSEQDVWRISQMVAVADRLPDDVVTILQEPLPADKQ